jgi:hypothetical protein
MSLHRMIRVNGSRMPDKLDADHHVARYVPWARLRKDEHNNVLGVLGAAFRLREQERFLSATWLEYFDGSHREQVLATVKAIRASKLQVKPKSGFAVGCVLNIDNACRTYGHTVRFLHEPEEDNAAHAALRRWPREAEELFELLAEEAWCTTILNADVPA